MEGGGTMGRLHLVMMQSGCYRWGRGTRWSVRVSKSPKVRNNLQRVLSNEKKKQFGKTNR